MKIVYSAIVFKENHEFIAYSPQLDLSSCGNSPEEARKMLKEAAKLFIEEIKKMGTLKEVLEELGYKREKNLWKSPELIEIFFQEVA